MIEPGPYWARWKGWTDSKLQPWEIIDVGELVDGRQWVYQFYREESDSLENWEFGPRLLPPE